MKEVFVTRGIQWIPALLAGALLAGCGNKGAAGGQQGWQMPPPPVSVVEVVSEPVAVSVDYAGRVRGAREVEVRARVGGILEERLYEEGQFVKQGDPLFRIDQEPYRIALQKAEAELANAQVDLNQAEREWKRVRGLFEQNAVSERERDRTLAAYELAQAQVKIKEAAVADAKLNLDYTIVTAPISGPTGLENWSEGSLIEKGSLLTTIVQVDPVHVRFAIPETDAAVIRTARQAMGDPQGHYRREAKLLLPGGEEYEQAGEIDFTHSIIDPQTGTVMARAVFPNPNGELVPGQFVRVRVILQEHEKAFLIDPKAVGEGMSGPQVFVVNKDNTVVSQPVKLGPVVDGKQVILEGLNDGDLLVFNGQVALRDGMQVSVVNPKK